MNAATLHIIDEAVSRALATARPEYLTRKQLAAELGITVQTLATFEAEGLPGHQIGPRTYRFVRSEVDEWIRNKDGASTWQS